VGNADITSAGIQALSVTGIGLNAIEIGDIIFGNTQGQSIIGGNQTITAGTGAQSGSIRLRGGSGSGASAEINGATINLGTTGTLEIIGGSAAGTMALIGSSTASAVTTIGTIAAPIGGIINLTGGSHVEGLAAIGTTCATGPCPATVTINGGGDVLLNSVVGEAFIGSLTQDTGSVTIKSGLLGSGDLDLGDGRVLINGDVTLEALAAGAQIRTSIIDAGLGTLSAIADDFLDIDEIQGGILMLRSNTSNIAIRSFNPIQARAAGLSAGTPAITFEAPQGRIEFTLVNGVGITDMSTVSGGLLVTARDKIDFDFGDEDTIYTIAGNIDVTSLAGNILASVSAEFTGASVSLNAFTGIDTQGDITDREIRAVALHNTSNTGGPYFGTQRDRLYIVGHIRHPAAYGRVQGDIEILDHDLISTGYRHGRLDQLHLFRRGQSGRARVENILSIYSGGHGLYSLLSIRANTVAPGKNKNNLCCLFYRRALLG
jgi:hypothetical protein